MNYHRQLALIEMPYLVDIFASDEIIVAYLENKGLGYDRALMYGDIRRQRDRDEEDSEEE